MKIVVILPTFNELVNIRRFIPLLEEEIFPKIKTSLTKAKPSSGGVL